MDLFGSGQEHVAGVCGFYKIREFLTTKGTNFPTRTVVFSVMYMVTVTIGLSYWVVISLLLEMFIYLRYVVGYFSQSSGRSTCYGLLALVRLWAFFDMGSSINDVTIWA